ncbi:hypothetical protein DCS32_11515 [Dokdonia sp. Dokd-P16]|uniref:CsgE family curli-type amyloid fiber assembly protein n=1 Tax=Dokdonia sp. Dokd-P16 TaxID=2173169 RepID=UPI000D548DB7|nr:CsgE family curli-type amyloid fiber assembly protein [Dokdonia sp. Dokd-P16]AWH74761.1 hypothetical protein DCS32_11515 [Dokdonia sp. Dokd-P16]
MTDIRQILALVIMLLWSTMSVSQFYNKEVKAEIRVQRNSEFLEFFAIAENKTPSDLSLTYDFMIFQTDDDGEVNKTNEQKRFEIKGRERKVLRSLSLSNSFTNRVVIAFLIYDLDGKPVGKYRIELPQGSQTKASENEKISKVSKDQEVAQDGFEINGLVIQKTITKAGRDFYRFFYSDYYNKGIKTNKNITIVEIPGRQRSTRISVKVGDKIVWQFFSQPKKTFLQEMASLAMGRCIVQLQNLERQKEDYLKY